MAPVILKREMAVTHAEFYRLINKTIDGMNKSKLDQANAIVSIPLSSGKIVITLAKQGIRKIASLSIPQTMITFTFHNLTRNEIDTYIRKFDTTFHKGGG